MNTSDKPVRKSTICVDFDGVIHSYSSGWQGAKVIPDPPVPGAMEWLSRMANDVLFEICIYSSRSKEPGAIEAMHGWLKHWLAVYAVERAPNFTAFDGLDWADSVLSKISFPTQKPAANMTIDDRAFCFTGHFPTAEWLLDFKPWNKMTANSKLQYERPSQERIDEISAALQETSYDERDPYDHAIGELLTEIYYLRGGR
jgi:hypothetical protein